MNYKEEIEWHKIERDSRGVIISELPNPSNLYVLIYRRDDFKNDITKVCIGDVLAYYDKVIAWSYLPKGEK